MNSCHAKLIRVMADIGEVHKDGVNAFHNYKYVTEGAVVEAARSALIAHGVTFALDVLSVDVKERQTKSGQSFVTTIMAEARFTDADTGDVVRYNVLGCGDDPADKGVMKAMTAAKKYALTIGLLIATGDDPEADEKTDKREPAPRSAPSAPAAPGAQPAPQGDINDLWDAMREAVKHKVVDGSIIARDDAGKKARADVFSTIIGRRIRGVPDLSEDEKARVAADLRRRVALKGQPLGDSWEGVPPPKDSDIPF